ncbi:MULTISPECIES: ATP-binding protein [Clostridium]|uniref:AAA domain-containing protein n=1 Tax=Clostridium cadaveris TaxID=1529 RepID=A0A1I2LI22_9CLOT|nr:AAA family ATPase [Clostridium cadaveris]MDM8310707.1 AAA family ATPase [Clostridium cadaveris]MDU4951437.1 AAA family ATPase [Clostridium sp.]UFH64256.1 AAA family ATPase [Clostridium cadaveris]SFF79072.1 AAA domain-containing protein [Clostridium cadaveris]
MIIKELNIKSFGAIKNKKISLTEGINVIYGKNESGKSTTEGFISILLYGMSGGRKNLKQNERKRFIPWKENTAQGEIHIKHGEDEIIIERTFGSTKKEDTINFINFLTGEKIKGITKEPGRYFLDLSKESFMKTLLIKQLGAEVARDKEEEIMQKLTNLEQGGDDSISYYEAVAVLENYKKFYVGSRKNGELDSLRKRLLLLTEELSDSLKRNEDGIEDEIKLKELKDEGESLIKNLKALELYKKYMRKMNLQKEYEEISKYLKMSKDLGETKDQYDRDLGQYINEEVLNRISEDYKQYESLNDELIYQEECLKEAESNYDIFKDEYERLEAFQGLEDDVDIKLIKLLEERKGALIKLEHRSKCKKNLDNIENEINEVKGKIEKYGIIDDERNDIDKILERYEDALKELKYLLNTYSSHNNITISNEEIKKNKIMANLLEIGAIASAGIFIFQLIKKSAGIPMYFLAIISIVCIFLSFKIKNHANLNEMRMKDDQKKYDSINSLKEEIVSIENKLESYYNKLGIKNYEEFVAAIKCYDVMKDKEERLKYVMREKLIEFNSYEGESLENSLNRANNMINFLLNHTSCENEEEFLRNHKLYEEKAFQMDSLERELKNLESNVSTIKNKLDIKEIELKNELSKIERGYIPLEKLTEEIEILKNKLKMKVMVENEIKRVEDGYKLLLKDRHLEDMKDELQDIFKEDIDFSFEKEEDVDTCLKENNEKLRETEKSIKDVENSISNRFKGFREPWIIEEEIEEVKSAIENGEEAVKIADIALENLNQCFKELQKNFGPKLNKIVGKIYSKLTDGKYEEVKVSDNYDLLVRDNKENSLVEANYLSNGAFDQAYFALRMALIEMIFGEDKVPIILDDTFIQYDDERTLRALKILEEYSENKQIILLTCQSREKDYFERVDNANIITMEGI